MHACFNMIYVRACVCVRARARACVCVSITSDTHSERVKCSHLLAEWFPSWIHGHNYTHYYTLKFAFVSCLNNSTAMSPKATDF